MSDLEMVTMYLINDGTCFQFKNLRTPTHIHRDSLRLEIGFFDVEDYYLSELQFEEYASYTLDNSDVLVEYLEPGRQYDISFKMKTTEYVNNPGKFTCNSEESYDVVECRLKCSIQDEERRCPCQPAIEAVRKLQRSNESFLLPSTDPPICSPWELGPCFQARAQSNASVLNLSFRQCKGMCEEPCLTHSYDFKAVNTPFHPSIVAAKFSSKSNELNKQMLRSKLSISFSTEADRYTYVRQYATMNFLSVFSYLGGQLGFFLGCSLLSVVHLAVFILKQLGMLVPWKPRKRPPLDRSYLSESTTTTATMAVSTEGQTSSTALLYPRPSLHPHPCLPPSSQATNTQPLRRKTSAMDTPL